MQITVYGLTYLMFAGLFSLVAFVIPLTTLLRFLTPKSFLDRYFCAPYFGESEINFYTGIPYYIMRTWMFNWAVVFPSRVKKRGIIDIREGCPNWFVWVNRIFMGWMLIHSSGVMLLLIGLSLYSRLFPSVS
ncbi:MAG: hypothetical protein JKY01_04800 [Pseudomonadales bacterium]|nr:hypothetical protein [Pseudomonadales bacterium]